jgi:RimJ/RimL family protein N-acetyltransferase
MTAITQPELLTLPQQLPTQRLIVRTYRHGDGEALFAAIDASREHLKKRTTWVDSVKTPADREVYVRRMQSEWVLRSGLVFGMFLPDDRTLIGGLGLHDPNWDVPSLMMGWWVAASHAGQGYTTEAAQAVLDFGFEHAQATRIWAGCDADNAASERIMQKIGMQREALLRSDGRNPQGGLRDSLIYAKTRPAAQ